MAGGLLALLDDVATLLDDTVVMSKVAAKKTSALLGDDLAVNAEKATGYHASRELPVIWAITKGSLINKVIILPIAFLLSAFMPWLIVPILLLGGAYLSFEGVEKVVEWVTRPERKQPAAFTSGDKNKILKSESAKIKAAIRTDFILSIEIVVIALDTVRDENMIMQIVVVSLIALAAVVAVYGVVAMLVRMDDVGCYLTERASGRKEALMKLVHMTGVMLINALPKVIRVLGIIGTLAMLLVGGGMYVHNIDAIHHLFAAFPAMLGELTAGLVIGAIIVPVMHMVHKLRH